MYAPFSMVKVGAVFKYDGETFVKTDTHRAWSLRNGKRWKEWAFNPRDLCGVVPANTKA